MRFDIASFLIGVIVGVGLAFIAYRQRDQLTRLVGLLRARLQGIRASITANVEARYQTALRAQLDQFNLARAHGDFNALYVDRFFDQPPARPTLTPIDPAELKPIDLGAALRGTTRLAVLGESGSGRTTLLIKLAHVLLDNRAQAELGLSREYLPLFAHLDEIDWSRATEADPLTALADAAASHTPALIAPNVSGLLKNRLRTNSAALLLDGFDELSAATRARAIAWLHTFVKKFPDNLFVITGGSLGYGALNHVGFAALKLSLWTTNDLMQYARRWIKIVSGGEKDLSLLSAGLRQIDPLTPRPLDLTLAALLWKDHATLPKDRMAAFGQWIDRVLQALPTQAKMDSDKVKFALGNIAWTLYQEHRNIINDAELEKEIGSLLPTPAPADRAATTELIAEVAHGLVHQPDLLTSFGLHGWTFRHLHIAAYLAAWHALQTQTDLRPIWLQPEWSTVIDFYAAQKDPYELIKDAMSAPDDLSRSNLWLAARWTGLASLDAPWRSKVVGELARSLLQPDQISALRDRTVTALVATHDKGLSFILKRSLAQPDPRLRAQSLKGLGALNRDSELPVLMAALKDPDNAVRVAAIEAIGSMGHTGSDDAVKALISIVLEQQEDLRQLAAEQLAQCGAEGHQILREAAGEEDLKIRHAAAYGLAATNESWARELLTKMERDDSQWFVRTAATDALKIMNERATASLAAPSPDFSPIEIDQQGWLTEWAATQGIGIGVGKQATQALMRALDEGSTPVRLAAIQTILHIGDLSHHDKLRTLLFDPDRSIRDAAFNALEAIGARAGQAIPR
jgi:HEAT repeat protein/GTPase SAR1 family protein